MPITLDGTALSGAGWFLVRSTGLDDIPTLALDTSTIPYREELVVASAWRSPAARDVVLTVGCLADTAADLSTATRALNALLPDGEIMLTHTRRPGQRLRVYVLGAPSSYGPGPEAVEPYYLELGVRVTAVSPYWEDATEQTVTFGSTATAIPMGLADCRGVITVAASGSSVENPVLTYVDADGVTQATISPTVTIADGDAWQIDVERGLVQSRVSGTWSNAITTLPDAFVLPVFRRQHSNYTTSDWPTLAVSAGAGTVTYRRRYP